MAETSFRRAKKDRNYTVMNNTFLLDERLSTSAKGLFAYLLFLPEDWVIYQSELSKHFSNGKDSIRSTIKELESFGYIIKEKARQDKGKFCGYNYIIVESPDKENRDGKPAADSPKSDNPPIPITNNNQILNKSNTDKTTLSAQSSSEADSTSESSSSNQSANPISLAEREELRKKDEEIKELRKIVESLKADKESKPVKKTKTRKTKTDEELQTLFSEFSETDIQITTNCINNFIAVKQRNDPRFMRSRNQLDNWSYELLLFSKTQNRDLNEVATVWNWAINDHFWSSNINSVSAFTKKYESLIQKCNSRQNRGYQSKPKYNAVDFNNQNYNEIF